MSTMNTHVTGSRAGRTLKNNRDTLIRIGILAALIFLAWSINHKFLNPYNINSMLVYLCIYAFLALSQTMVMFIGELNLTIGVQLAFAPVLGLRVARMVYGLFGKDITNTDIYIVDGLPVIFIVILLTGVLLGLLLGWIILTFHVPSLIITLGMMYLLQGATYNVSGSASYAVFLTIDNVNFLTNTIIFHLPLSTWLLLLVIAFMIYLMHFTAFGKKIYAVGGNAKAAALAGINVKRWKTIAFILSGLFCSMAAIVWTSRMQSIDPSQGAGLQLTALSIAVIGGINIAGGKGTIFGTLIGSIIMTVALNLMQMVAMYQWYQNVIIGLIILVTAAQQAIELYRETHR